MPRLTPAEAIRIREETRKRLVRAEEWEAMPDIDSALRFIAAQIAEGDGFLFDIDYEAGTSNLNWHGLDIGLREGQWAPTRGQSGQSVTILHYVVVEEFDDEATAGCEPYPLSLPSGSQLRNMAANRARPCRRCAALYNKGNWKFRGNTPAEENEEMGITPNRPARNRDYAFAIEADGLVEQARVHDSVVYHAAIAPSIESRDPDRMAGLMAQKMRIDEQIAKLAARPVEPEFAEDGTGPIVVFDKTFGDEVEVWTYVAMKVRAGYWLLSGHKQAGKPYTWQGLLDFAESQEPDLPQILLVTAWEPI